MAIDQDDEAADSPDQMLSFLPGSAQRGTTAAYRTGTLILGGRHIETPHYVATTSRGVVPHIAPDLLQKHTSINAVYMGLEDFVEKSRTDAPIFKFPAQSTQSPLRKYTGLPPRCISILGPRRVPAIPCPAQNTNSAISICTSIGFSSMEVKDYLRATSYLKPDVATSLADVVYTDQVSVKRIMKSADRTHAWLRDQVEGRSKHEEIKDSPLLATMPPLEPQQQSYYLSDLGDEYLDSISGLCLHSSDTATSLPPVLSSLPKLCLSNPGTAHDILRALSLGVDMITVPFVTSASESGIAFSFTFGDSPLANNQHENHSTSDQTPDNHESSPALPPHKLPLGFDLWASSQSSTHATDTSPLTADCPCYTCTRHHRAYIHHLLQAKEMLAWTLLQIHNFHILDQFFSAIRTSISQNTFDKDMQRFEREYETDFPERTGEGPRVRGYQTKSVGGGEPKRNAKAYGKLDEQLRKLAEVAAAADDDDGVAKLEDQPDTNTNAGESWRRRA